MTIILFFVNKNFAQTNLTPQSLPYAQNFGTTTFSVMPSGTAAWTINGSPAGSQSSAESSTNSGNATVTAATAVQSTGGVYGYATSSNGRFYVQTSSNATNGTSQLITAINTTGQSGVTVSYDVEMITVTARTIGVVLQYRIGTSGSWTTVSGSAYSHNSSDRANGAVDNFASLSLPSAVNNNAVVQLRWATWRGSESGNSSGIAIDNISIAGANQQTWYFRSAQTGNWNQSSTWQSSVDNTNWGATYTTPDYTSNTITIQSSHTVSITASLTLNQTVVNGTLIYADNSGSTLTINDGTGVDLTINGTYQDIGPQSNVWSGSSSWSFGANGTLLRTRSTSSNNWKDRYEGGISTIPSTATWIVRKTGTDNPALSSTGGMYYPNLKIENTSGASWNFIGFTGSTAVPTIKGNFDIGGSGANPVVFVNQNTYSSLIPVNGNFIVQSGSTMQNDGTGFTFLGNVTNQGSYTGTTKNLSFTGTSNQTVAGASSAFSDISALTINKTSGSVILSTPVVIKSSLVLTQGYLQSTVTNQLKFADNSTVTGGADNAFVQGSIVKTGDDAFVFPLGDLSISGSGKYHPLTITAPTAVTDAFTAAYFASAQTNGNAKDTIAIDSLSTCEYWTLARTTGTSQVKVGLTWTASMCDLPSDLNEMRLAFWDGTKWVNVGDVVSGNKVTSNNNLSTFGFFTLAQESCPIRRRRYPLQISGPTEVCSGVPTVNLVASVSPAYNGAYSWTAPTSLSGATYSVTPINNGNSNASTTYTAQFQYWSGCVFVKSYTLTVKPGPIANAGGFYIYEPDDLPLTLGGTPIASGGITPYTSSWLPNNGSLSCTSCENPNLTPTNSQTYTLTVTGNNGCSDQDIANVIVSKNLCIAKREIESIFYLAKNGAFAFEYFEEYSDVDSKLEYSIKDLTDNHIVMSESTNPLFVIKGTNRYDLNLSALTTGFYMLEIVNEKKEKFYLRIKV